MESYCRWQDNKVYEGHLFRLKKLSIKDDKIHHKKNKNKLIQESLQNQNCYRSKTEEINPKKKQSRRMLRVPIPLVSGSEAKLLKDTLNARQVSLKDKEHILENYLLSRRILKTKSALKLQNSVSMKKNLKNQHNTSAKSFISTSRDRKFRIYSKEKQDTRNMMDIAEGSNYLEFKIKNIMMIKGVLGRGAQVAYNLDIKVGKHQGKEAKAMSYEEMFQRKFRIRWKSGLCNKKPEIMMIIYVLRENFSQELGLIRFSIEDFQHEKKVYRIMKGKFPVGTIQLQGDIFNKNREAKNSPNKKPLFNAQKQTLPLNSKIKYQTEYHLYETSLQDENSLLKEEEDLLISKFPQQKI